MKLRFTPKTLFFKRPFSIAHGSRDSTPVVFTQLEQNGFFGYGEASMPPYLGEDHGSVLAFLSKAEKILQQFTPNDPIETILSAVDAVEAGNTAAKASVDIALHDLVGSVLKIPCHTLFGAENANPLFTAYTIAIDGPEGIRLRVEEAREYNLLKVKLGSPDDKKLILEIRKHTDKDLIVDANEGWTDKQAALDMILWLTERNVRMVEQPMPKEQAEDISWLTSKSPVPIMADEAVKRLQDVEKAKGVYTGINIKLMKCTGLHEAQKMIRLAREYGMKVMIGCMSESSCAVSAAAQLAPLADWIDLDGPLLIKEDPFSGVKFSEGKILLNNLPGLGIRPAAALF